MTDPPPQFIEVDGKFPTAGNLYPTRDVYVHAYVRHQGGKVVFVDQYWRRANGLTGDAPVDPELKKRILEHLEKLEKQLVREGDDNREQIRIDSDKLHDLPITDLVDRVILGREIEADEGTVMSDDQALDRVKQLRGYWTSHR